MKELNLWNSVCKENEVLSFSLSLNAKLFSNHNKSRGSVNMSGLRVFVVMALVH